MRNDTGRIGGGVGGSGVWCAAGLVVMVCGLALGAGGDDYATAKRGAVAALEPKYAAIVAANSGDAALGELRQRLACIDKVVELLSSRLRSASTASMDTMLTAGLPNARSGKTPTNTMSAAEILLEYQGEFSAGLSRPKVSDEQLKVLLDYYNAAVKAAEDHIAKRGRSMGMVDEKLGVDALQLSMVLPLLHVADADWTMGRISALAEWMKTPKSMETIEAFALSVKRPLTAYQFALYQKALAERSGRSLSAGEYLRAATSKLLAGSDYHAAIHCLRVAVETADGAGKTEDAVALRLQRADVLNTMGHPKLAAEETKVLLEKYPRSASFGRSAMLRLKYLYEAEQLPVIVEEARQYADDRRAASYLPQVLYIQWQTLRRLDRGEEMKKVQDAFLSRFPEHVLGADMYFASAMTALAAFNYPEAQRLLEVIEYRYPNSKIAPKVKEIQKRLQQMTEGGK